jgi:glycine oxidase
MHTVILGNGIIALSIAFRLIQRATAHDKITIVGKRERAGSATLAAAAMLNSFAEIEAGALDSDLEMYRFELSHLATRMWPKFEKELILASGADRPLGCRKCEGFPGGGCVGCGTYVVNNTAADNLDDENYDAIVKALQDFDEPFQHVSPQDIPNYMPTQRYRATRALYIPNEGWYNPRLMLEKIDMILERHPQVEFVEQMVDQLNKSGNQIQNALLFDRRTIEGDKFVLATGASVSDILARSKLGINVQRVFYGVGVSVEIKSPDYPHTKCIRTPNRGLACGIYSVPYFLGPDVPNDHILIGASNFISPTPYMYGRITSVEHLMKSAMEQINSNFYRADLVRVNVGWRPTSQDTHPLLGKTSIGNLVIASGTKRDGFHMSPLISQIMTSLLYDEPIDERFNYFAPERRPINQLSREQAIEKAVRHQMSAAYQHGFSPSFSRMPDQLKQMYRDDLERLHDKIGAVDWGIPPEMLDMYRYGHAVA